MARGSMAKYEHEAMGHFEDRSFAGTRYDLVSRVQYNCDAGGHFFGVGPDTPRSSETNYKADFLLVRAGAGLPLFEDSGWRAHFVDRMLTEKVTNGPINNLPGFDTTFPEFATAHHHQSNELRAVIDFDTRDHPITTTEGTYVEMFEEHAFNGFLSEYEFGRAGFDGRYFYRWPNVEKKRVTAFNVRFEQLTGNAPFWLLPQLGGKYSLRAYGEGRYVDRSVLTLNLEQRFTFYETHMGGVTTQFELSPFIGMGQAADNPGRYAARYTRPVFGGAIRAVARPQVVGSVDFGVGQEGLSVFTDINYSF
jgi:outer membrane protein assembly factor BamA